MQSQKLHRLELEVMKVVWRLGKATVNDVRDALKQPLAYTSVATTLNHLEKKGFLTPRCRRAYVRLSSTDSRKRGFKIDARRSS